MSEQVVISEDGVVVEEPKTAEKEIPTVKSMDKEQRQNTKEEVKEETESKKIELELERGYRIVNIEGYGELWIHKPTIEDDYVADLAYSQEFNKLMDESNLPTSEEMENKLEQRGKWTQLDKDELDDLRKEMISLSSDIILKKAEYKSNKSKRIKNEINKLQKEYESSRTKFFKKQAVHQKYMSMTIEGRADEKRLVFKMSRCVKRPDGQRVWETPEKLMEEKDSVPVGTLVYEFITFMQGVDPRVLQEVPDILKSIGDADF